MEPYILAIYKFVNSNSLSKTIQIFIVNSELSELSNVIAIVIIHDISHNRVLIYKSLLSIDNQFITI